jgi:NitT/TauT family transport system substrate-binding protein
MKISRHRALAAIAASYAVVPRAAQAQPALATIRIATPPVESFLPGYYAMRAGLFERAGIKIELSKGASSGAAVAAGIAGGAIDIGLSSMLAIVLGHVRGIGFTIVAPAGLWLPTSTGGLLVRSSSPIRTAKDFVGKTFASSAVNDFGSLGLRAWMDANGADWTTVKVVEIPQIPAVAALEQGRVDGIGVINVAYTLATSGGQARSIGNIWSVMGPRLLLSVYFASSDWVARNHAVAERFARVIAEASTYVNGHANETLGDLAELTGLDRDLLTKTKRIVHTPSVVAAEVQPTIDAAVKYKFIERAFPASEIIADVAVK